MPNPWGTALQVLAGAFGGGASSLGKSRMDQARIDEENRREDAQRLVENKRDDQRLQIQGNQFDRSHKLALEQARARQAQVDEDRKRTALGENAYSMMLADRGFPPEVIQAIMYGGASAATYLGPNGMYAKPGDRRGTSQPRATTGDPRWSSNNPAAGAASPAPPAVRSGRRPRPEGM